MAPKSVKRAAYEARIWRFAYLMTGSAARAASVVTAVGRAKPRLTELDPTHLDRLVILRARECEAAAGPSAIDALSSLVTRVWRAPRSEQATRTIPHPSTPDPPSVAGELLRRVVEMDHQPREAWILARFDEVEEMWMARAMDCSRTAAAMHLGAADRHVMGLFENDEPALARAIAALRAHVDGLDVLPIVDHPRAEDRRRWAPVLAVAGAVLLALGALVLAQL